jgi:hypothetical protein
VTCFPGHHENVPSPRSGTNWMHSGQHLLS